MINDQQVVREPQCDIEPKRKVSSIVQNKLFEFEDDTNMVYDNISYEGTSDIIMHNGKPKESWMLFPNKY